MLKAGSEDVQGARRRCDVALACLQRDGETNHAQTKISPDSLDSTSEEFLLRGSITAKSCQAN